MKVVLHSTNDKQHVYEEQTHPKHDHKAILKLHSHNLEGNVNADIKSAICGPKQTGRGALNLEGVFQLSGGSVCRNGMNEDKDRRK